MKKILVITISIIIGIILGIFITLKSIQIDSVNEVDNGIVTIKIFNNYLDYEYEYHEVDRQGLFESGDYKIIY